MPIQDPISHRLTRHFWLSLITWVFAFASLAENGVSQTLLEGDGSARKKIASSVADYLDAKYGYRPDKVSLEDAFEKVLKENKDVADSFENLELWLDQSDYLNHWKWDGTPSQADDGASAEGPAPSELFHSSAELAKQSEHMLPKVCDALLAEWRKADPPSTPDIDVTHEGLQFDSLFAPCIDVTINSPKGSALVCNWNNKTLPVEVLVSTPEKRVFRVSLEGVRRGERFPFGGKGTLNLEIEYACGTKRSKEVRVSWPEARTGNLIPLPSDSREPSSSLVTIGLRTPDGKSRDRKFLLPKLDGTEEPSVKSGYSAEFPTALVAGNDEWILHATIQRLKQLELWRDENGKDWSGVKEKLKELSKEVISTEAAGLSALGASILNSFAGDVKVIMPPSVPKLSISVRDLVTDDQEIALGVPEFPDGVSRSIKDLAALKKWGNEEGRTFKENLFERTVEISGAINDKTIDSITYFQSIQQQLDGNIPAALAVEIEGEATFEVTGKYTLRGFLSNGSNGNESIEKWTLAFSDVKVCTRISSPTVAGQAQLGLLSFNVSAEAASSPFNITSELEVNNGQAIGLGDVNSLSVRSIKSEANPLVIRFDSVVPKFGFPMTLEPRSDTASEKDERNNALFKIKAGSGLGENEIYKIFMRTPLVAATSMVGVYGDRLQLALRDQHFGSRSIPILSGHSLKTLLNFDEKYRDQVIRKLDDAFKRSHWIIRGNFSRNDKLQFRINGIEVDVPSGGHLIDEISKQPKLQGLVKEFSVDTMNGETVLGMPRGTRVSVRKSGSATWESFYSLETPSVEEVLNCIPGYHTCEYDSDQKKLTASFRGSTWKESRDIPLGTIPPNNGIGEIAFEGDVKVPVAAALKVNPFAVELACTPLTDQFSLTKDSKLVEIPNWKRYQETKPSMSGSPRVAVRFSNGQVTVISLPEMANTIGDLIAAFPKEDVSIDLAGPSSTGDFRFTFEEKNHTVAVNRKNGVSNSVDSSGADASGGNGKALVPLFEIMPYRDPSTNQIDVVGYRMGMALGIFGSDLDDDGKIIGSPLHGKTWEKDRITVGDTANGISIESSLEFKIGADTKLKGTSYGFLKLHGKVESELNAFIKRGCSIASDPSGKVAVNLRDEGFEEPRLELSAELSPIEQKCTLAISLLSSGVTLEGQPPKLGSLSFSDRSLSLDWRIDELPGLDESERSALSNANSTSEDSNQASLVTLRDLADWLRQYKWTIKFENDSTSVVPADAGGSASSPTNLNMIETSLWKIKLTPSLMQVFEKALLAIREMEKADGATLKELNVSLNDLSSMTESFEKMVFVLRNASPKTLPAVFDALGGARKVVVEGKDVWVLDLKKLGSRSADTNYHEKLLVKLDINDALEFTWFRQESLQREFSVALGNGKLLTFDVKPVPHARITGQVAVSFGFDLKKFADEKQAENCFFIGCASDNSIKSVVTPVEEIKLVALLGKTFVAGQVDVSPKADVKADVTSKLISGIVNHSGKLSLPDNPLNSVGFMPEASEGLRNRHYIDFEKPTLDFGKPMFDWSNSSVPWIAAINESTKEWNVGKEKLSLDLSGLGTSMDVALSRLFGDLQREMRKLDAVPIVGGKANLVFSEVDSLLNAFRNQNQSLDLDGLNWESIYGAGGGCTDRLNSELQGKIATWWGSALGDWSKLKSSDIVVVWVNAPPLMPTNERDVKDWVSKNIDKIKIEIPLDLSKKVPVRNIPLDLKIPGLGFRMDDDARVDFTVEFQLQGKLIIEGATIELAAKNETTPAQITIKPQVTLPSRLGTAKNSLATLDITTNSGAGCSESTAPQGIDLTITSVLSNGGSSVNLSEIKPTNTTIQGNINLPLVITASANNENIPRVRSGLVIATEIGQDSKACTLDQLGDALKGTKVTFCDVEINVGDLVNRILRPACDKIKAATEPVREVTAKLTDPLPALGELSGGVTLLDLADVYAKPEQAKAARQLVRSMQEITKITERLDKISALGKEGDGWVKHQDLFSTRVGDFAPGANLVSLSAKDLSKGEGARQVIADIETQLEASFQAASKSPKASSTSSFKKSIGETKIRVPLLDNPSTALCLLLGKDVSLFEVDLPKVELEFEYSEFFPVVGPIGARIGGVAGLKVEMGFGYDTYGFRTKKAIDGFFIADLDAAGYDRAEVTVTAGLFAAAEVSIVVARAGAGGGVYIDVFLNLHDENGDGKIRFSELAEITQPHHLFDLGGRIYGKIFAYYEIGFRAMGEWVHVAGENWEREQTILDFNSKTRPMKPATPKVFFKNNDNENLSN